MTNLRGGDRNAHTKVIRMAMLLKEAARRPLSVFDVSVLLGIKRTSAVQYIDRMRSAGLLYVAEWQSTGVGPIHACYRRGNLPDAPKPRKIPRIKAKPKPCKALIKQSQIRVMDPMTDYVRQVTGAYE